MISAPLLNCAAEAGSAVQPEALPEVRQKSGEIINEADKVAAQLNEFINYSRPREVRRSRLHGFHCILDSAESSYQDDRYLAITLARLTEQIESCHAS